MMQAHAFTVENQEVASSLFAQSEAKFGVLKESLVSAEARTMTHSELERHLEVQGRELMRLLLRDHLSIRAQQECELGVEGPGVGDDGIVRRDLRESDRKLMTVHDAVTEDRR